MGSAKRRPQNQIPNLPLVAFARRLSRQRVRSNVLVQISKRVPNVRMLPSWNLSDPVLSTVLSTSNLIPTLSTASAQVPTAKFPVTEKVARRLSSRSLVFVISTLNFSWPPYPQRTLWKWQEIVWTEFKNFFRDWKWKQPQPRRRDTISSTERTS